MKTIDSPAISSIGTIIDIERDNLYLCIILIVRENEVKRFPKNDEGEKYVERESE